MPGWKEPVHWHFENNVSESDRIIAVKYSICPLLWGELLWFVKHLLITFIWPLPLSSFSSLISFHFFLVLLWLYKRNQEDLHGLGVLLFPLLGITYCIPVSWLCLSPPLFLFLTQLCHHHLLNAIIPRFSWDAFRWVSTALCPYLFSVWLITPNRRASFVRIP